MSLKTGAELDKTKKNQTGSIYYSRVFDYFKNALSSCLDSTTEEFFNNHFNFYMISMNDGYDVLFKGDEYFVTEIKISKDVSLKVRLSSAAVDLLLLKAFGPGESIKFFTLEKITELEAKIITAFNNEIYKNLKPVLRPQEEIKKLSKSAKLKNNLLFFTFYIYDEEENYGKIILSIPEQILLEAPSVQTSQKELPDSLFNKTPACVDIFVGETKSSLEELSKLEPDDIIVLDNSESGVMFTGDDFDFPIKVKPDVSLVYDCDETGDYGEEHMPKKLTETKMWDNIQVDVKAEFEKVKMPLGDLKQISEGLVVDLASVYNNKITLKVEKSKIAEGELVIIGDRYGVRLSAVFNQDEDISDTSESNHSEDEEEESSAQNENSEDDDAFDMDEFDIEEDEDI